MTPSTTTQNTSMQDSPTITPKRSLRNRGSNVGISSKDGDGVVGDADNQPLVNSESVGGGGIGGVNGGGDARVNGDTRKRKRSPSTVAEHSKEKRLSLAKSKETPEERGFKEFVSNVFTLMSSRDPTPSVMHCAIPLHSELDNPRRSKTEPPEEQTLHWKMSNNEYTTVSQIEDDLMNVTQSILKTIPLNTDSYNAVTAFFTYAQDILLSHPQTQTKPGSHSLRSSSTPAATTNGTTSPQIPNVRPPLREALYTMGPSGPLFTSIASNSTNPLLARKLPSSITLPTPTGGTFTTSAVSIIPTNFSTRSSRTLADTSRPRQTFEQRKRGSFSEDTLGKVQCTKWLDWGYHCSFAPQWDDGGVGGGFGAEWMVMDWAYKRARREKNAKVEVEEVKYMEDVEQVIDEKLLLEWDGPAEVPKDLVVRDADEEEENGMLSVDEILDGLRSMILVLGQTQTLRLALGKTEIPEDEMALAQRIVTTFQGLIVSHNIPPKALISRLPEDAYNIIQLTHPEFTGSLAAKNFPPWQPPQPASAQRGGYTPQGRPIQARDTNQQRIASGTPSYRPNMNNIQRYQGTPTSAPGYGSPAGYGTPGSMPPYRGVGRPRKYDIRR